MTSPETNEVLRAIIVPETLIPLCSFPLGSLACSLPGNPIELVTSGLTHQVTRLFHRSPTIAVDTHKVKHNTQIGLLKEEEASSLFSLLLCCLLFEIIKLQDQGMFLSRDPNELEQQR